MNLDLVIFDMDGVIFDSEKVYYEANQIAADKLGMDYSLAYYKQFIGAGTDAMRAQMIEDYGGDAQLIDDFLRISEENVHPLVEAGELKLKPGFVELSQYLQANDIAYTLASSNYKSEIEFFLEHTDVDPASFETIISADDVAEAKPAPDIFNKAWKKSGAPAKEKTIVIEDAFNGIKAANNAEIPVIMVPDIIQPTEEQRKTTVAILDDLISVREYLKNNY